MIKNGELIVDLFENSEKTFRQHLSIENNERIIFSGKFGHGKTTFLREFFNDENQLHNFKAKKYNVISLFPVNYSIASNEDIFKYIKYDIILEMLNADMLVEEVLISQIDLLPKYLRKNATKVIGTIISMIPKIGKDGEAIFSKCVDLVKDFKEFHKKSEDEANPENVLINFFDELEQKEGSLYEDNIVSKTIECLLAKSKETEAVESILLVDDLDRIDPEHIFRMLNVFSAHFDRKNSINSKNKFGFDKIIVVCDIGNIRNIFKAKYGVETDFNGYIDKFYSYEVFDYALSNFQSIAYSILNKTINLSRYHKVGIKSELLFFKDKYVEDRFFVDMLRVMIEYRQIDMRNISKWHKLPIPIKSENNFMKGLILNNSEHPLIMQIRLLCMLKGDIESLKDSFLNVNTSSIDKKTLRNYIEQLLYIVTIYEHNNVEEKNIHYHVDDIHIMIDIDSNKLLNIRRFDAVGLNFKSAHLFWMLRKTIDFLREQKVL